MPHTSEECAPINVPLSGLIVAPHSVVGSEELLRRGSRVPDYEKENGALMKLAAVSTTSSSQILQSLVETVLDVTECDSSGVSLLTNVDGQVTVCWPAIAGMWGAPADVPDHNGAAPGRNSARVHPPVSPVALECLQAPFCVQGTAVGAVWAIMHSNRRMFDAEDERLMVRLGRFASRAYQSLRVIEGLRSEIAAHEKTEARMRELTGGLEEAASQAERGRQEAQLELANANRLATMGRVPVSIAHELSEPIAAAVANADAALHWLDAQPPNLDKARQALDRILRNGRRASEVIAGIGVDADRRRSGPTAASDV